MTLQDLQAVSAFFVFILLNTQEMFVQTQDLNTTEISDQINSVLDLVTGIYWNNLPVVFCLKIE
jgi:hypothetical protein